VRRLGVLALSSVAVAAGCGAHNEGAKTLAQTTNAANAARALQVLQVQTAPGTARRFSVRVLKATSQRVQLVLHNASKQPHNIAIKGNGIDVKGRVTKTDRIPSTVTATLKPGTYTFYSSVDGDEAAGMRGQLVVAAPA
jgi:plastocyanin